MIINLTSSSIKSTFNLMSVTKEKKANHKARYLGIFLTCISSDDPGTHASSTQSNYDL